MNASDSALLESLPTVFQKWSVDEPSEPGQVDFSGSLQSTSQAARWTLDLSADPHQAAVQLSQAEAQIALTHSLLARIPERIQFLTENLAGPDQHPTSFNLEALDGSPPIKLSAAEQELLIWIETITPRQVSFGLEPETPRAYQAAQNQLGQVINDLLNLVTKFAWIETRIEGRFLARTAVSWTGDMETVWSPVTLPVQIKLHQRSLKLGLATRITFLRLFTIITSGAGKISALIATPGGALLALPAAWKFTTRILDEIHNYQTVVNA